MFCFSILLQNYKGIDTYVILKTEGYQWRNINNY